MPSFTMVAELVLLILAMAGLFAVIGYGPVALLCPDLGGAELLLTPLVGLAILYWTSQCLSRYFASSGVIVGTSVIFGILACATALTKRKQFRARLRNIRRDLAILTSFGLLAAIAMQLPMLHSRIFSLADFSGDDLFTWSPEAAYMQTHAYASGHPTAYVSPLLWLLPTNIYPGSVGTVDGGLTALFGVHTYQLVEPLSAVCLALGACAVYLLLRVGLSTSRRIAFVGLLLAATSQFRFVIAGFGFAQSARGSVLLAAALILFLVAFRKKHLGTAILAGGVSSVLAAVYMPMFLIILAGVLGGAIVILFPLVKRSVSEVPWKPVIGFIAGALVFGAQNVWWLLFDGGLHAWVLQTKYGNGIFFTKYPYQYLVGSAPFQYLYQLKGIPPFAAVKPLFWNGSWTTVSQLGALAFVVLMLLGLATLAAKKQALAAMCFCGMLVFGAAVFVINKGGFGSYQTVAYLTPLACALVAYGAFELSGRLPQRLITLRHASHQRIRTLSVGGAVLSITLALILGFQAAATAEDENFYVSQPGMLSAQNLKLSAIAAEIPKGATVLMYASDGSDGFSTVRKTQALVGAANFLPDRNITIDGLFFTGDFGPSDKGAISAAIPLDYEYILHYQDHTIDDPKVPSSYQVVWRFAQDHLVLYKRAVG